MKTLEILKATDNEESNFTYVFKVSGTEAGRGWNFRKKKIFKNINGYETLFNEYFVPIKK
jgi:hypothetical protein